MSERHGRIRERLERAERAGRIQAWYAYNPDDGNGKRWVVALKGQGSRTFSTSQAEAFVLGLGQ